MATHRRTWQRRMDRSGGDTVLARHGDPAANDGVHTAAIYTGLQLANNGDELP